MKVKYKKTVLFISLGILCVGAVTFSVRDNISNKKTKVDISDTVSPDVSQITLEPEVTGNEADDTMKLVKSTDSALITVVETYFQASVSADLDTLKTVVSDASSFSKELLEEENKYIEAYENIECYTINGYEEGSYIVYAYSELKLNGADTLAPGLTQLYLCKNADGDLVVYTGVLSDDQESYIEKAEQTDDVQALVKAVNSKYDEAKQEDKELYDLINKIKSEAGQQDTNSDSTDK